MSEVELREKIVIDGADAAASKLSMLAKSAKNVMASFHGLGEIVGAASGIAGMWKIAEGVHDVDQLYQAVMRVHDMTGLAAEKAHSLFDMFELSGIEMGSAERIITSMTAKGAKLEDGMAGVGATTQKLNKLYKDLGVSIKDGPEKRIVALSKAAVDGKLDINEMIQGFGLPRSQAAAMMSMLKQGPDKLKAIQDDTIAGADAINDATLESYRQMLQVRRELGDAFGDLIGVFYKNLIPAITASLQAIKSMFDDIGPVVAAIGKGLSSHMDLVVKAAKTYLALLIASKAVNLVSSEKMGIVGRGKQLFSGAMGFMERRAGAAGGMDFFAAKAANPGIGMFATAGGPIIRIISTVAGRLGIIGAVITVLIVAFEMLKRNVWGIRDMFVKAFGGIVETGRGIITKVIAVLGKLWEAIKPIVSVFAGALLFQILIIVKYIGFLGDVINAVMDAIIWIVNKVIGLINKLPGVSIDKIDLNGASSAADDGKRGTASAAGAGTYQDFRGSKFEINNNFPPGIDGGRVAVAFGDDLARLGERRLDSGVRPLFSFR
jgi:hypothetical protein